MPVEHPTSVKSYLARIGAEVLNFRRAMVKINHGSYYKEKTLIQIHSDGTVSCSDPALGPTEHEAAAIKRDLSGMEFPAIIRARTEESLRKDPRVKGPLYAFYSRDAEGGVIMCQEKRPVRGGRKAYVPWVMLSDGSWVEMEPEGALPFWKPSGARREEGGARIMIHEGSQSAAAAEAIARDPESSHPWQEALSRFEHWGMIGGALAPHRTDYKELEDEKPGSVVYVCDNDDMGIAALPQISYAWGRKLTGVRFNNSFPRAWDMADKLPKSFYSRKGRYLGPRLEDLMVPATWATKVIENPEKRGRPITKIRAEFATEWTNVVRPSVFVHEDRPNQILSSDEFNGLIAPFSSATDTALLLRKDFGSKSMELKYAPDAGPGIGHEGRELYINTFRPSDIKPEKGDAGPWLEFMEKLIPIEEDRTEVLRWCATLIARPAVRLMYGLLLVSEPQGVGKSTLGEKVLKPLVGPWNTSSPGEAEIVESNFNGWLAHKRLIVVHEIYAGNSSKAYNKLKSVLTDKSINVNQKYVVPYEVDCWAHLFACSNSMRALKLSMDDRRWLVPRVTMEKQTPKYWEGFNDWLAFDGGLEIIADWAASFGKPIQPGDEAPWTSMKKEMVMDSLSAGQAIVAEAVDKAKLAMEEKRLPLGSFLLDRQLVELIRNKLYEGRHNDKLERPMTVRAVAKACGALIGDAKLYTEKFGAEYMLSRVVCFDEKTRKSGAVELDEKRLIKLDELSAM